MKKNGYTVIKKPLGGYDFSFFRCHAAEIGEYVTGLIIFILICALSVCFTENGSGWNVLIENIYIPIICSVQLFLLSVSMTFRIRRVKKSWQTGKRQKAK